MSHLTPLPSVRPMLATAGALPASAQEDRWVFEMKWDGVRAVVYLDRGELRVLTRNDREVTGSYPELAGLAAALPGNRLVLDGEVVAFGAQGRPSFETLQERMHVRAPGAGLLARVPVSFLAFDLLHLDGRSLLAQPYRERRAALEALDLAGAHWAVPPVFHGHGAEALAVSQAQGLEGVLAKRADSPYQPGRRSTYWIKSKHLRTQEVVIGGWSAGQGRRDGGIGSLLVGVPGAGGRLDYAGRVGTGFSQAALADLAGRLRAQETASSPFADGVPAAHARGARWVLPRLVGEVTFAEWTRAGRLRHPTWRGLRPDKTPSAVRRES